MRNVSVYIFALATLSLSCDSSLNPYKDGEASSKRSSVAAVEGRAEKLTSDDCIDPDLSKLASDQQLMLCDGTIASGTYTLDCSDAANVATPDPWDVRYGVAVGGITGKLKTNCRNMVGAYDKTDGLAVSGLDVYDTIGDVNGGESASGSFNTPPFPSNNPWDSDEYFCGLNDPTDPTWELVTASAANSI